MKSDYWNVADEQVIEKTGKPLAHWAKVLDKFEARKKKSSEVAAFLQKRGLCLKSLVPESAFSGRLKIAQRFIAGIDRRPR